MSLTISRSLERATLGWPFRLSLILKILLVTGIAALLVMGSIQVRDRKFKSVKAPQVNRRNLVFADEQRDLPRPPPPRRMVPVDKGPSDWELAQKEIASLALLKELKLNFVLIVFGWKRRKSLQRLCDSLVQAEYHGFDVSFEFHIDGEPHPLVVEYMEAFQWPHGRMTLHRHAERVGLEKVKNVILSIRR